MANYQIEFLPSNFVLTGQKGQQQARDAIASMLNEYSARGYELAQIAQIAVTEPPGCLAGLLGQKAVSMEYNVLVFRSGR